MASEESLKNPDVIVYTLALLGGAQRTVHTEELAVKAYELAPSQFSWTLPAYRERDWPDKEVARLALTDARKEENGALVEGAAAREIAKDGWRLTPNGARWLSENGERIQSMLGCNQPRVPKNERRRFLTHIKKQALFKRFARAGSVAEATQFEFAELLNCSADAPADIVAAKFTRMRTTAELVKDEHIIRFLNACAEKFGQSLCAKEREMEGEEETR